MWIINEQKSEKLLKSDQKEHIAKNKIKKGLYFIGGTASLILGIIGIVLPILPTTPFLLLASACYAKSSKKFHNWLLNNKILGKYIQGYLKGSGIPIKSKIIAISMLWISISISAYFFVQILWIRIVLIIIAIAVTVHIILIRPKNKEQKIKQWLYFFPHDHNNRTYND